LDDNEEKNGTGGRTVTTTPYFTPQVVNFEPNIVGLVVRFPTLDFDLAPVDVSSGYSIPSGKALYIASVDPNLTGNNPIDFSAIGTFSFHNGYVQWDLETNDFSPQPDYLTNNYWIALQATGASDYKTIAYGLMNWQNFGNIV
jgi:hypothetical protein